MTDHHYANMTNGLRCPCLPQDFGILRIQSTWCEQKLWNDVLLGVGHDLLFRLANGARCVVHDVSERERLTRACYQGLSWIRFACNRNWGLPVGEEYVKGHNVTKYWEAMYQQLPARTHTHLRFFRKFHPRPFIVEPCGYIHKSEATP